MSSSPSCTPAVACWSSANCAYPSPRESGRAGFVFRSIRHSDVSSRGALSSMARTGCTRRCALCSHSCSSGSRREGAWRLGSGQHPWVAQQTRQVLWATALRCALSNCGTRVENWWPAKWAVFLEGATRPSPDSTEWPTPVQRSCCSLRSCSKRQISHFGTWGRSLSTRRSSARGYGRGHSSSSASAQFGIRPQNWRKSCRTRSYSPNPRGYCDRPQRCRG
mmetsp:Transcript_47530/g.110876  ORF Transcript_47530/g.110876 Transcript_47530/m.110876 type:complete len:221 (-) Transcript_47530:203-865(-)